MTPPFRKSFTTEEEIKWQNTLDRTLGAPGWDDLALELHNLVGGYIRRKFADIIDRTKTYDDIIVCSPVPELRPSKSYAECMEESARYIHSVVKEHSLTPYLLWSGGLDSTGALYALINEGVEFNVIFDQPAYDEYPKLAKAILNNEILNVTPIFVTGSELTFPEHTQENPDALYVTGDGVAGLGNLYDHDYEIRQSLIHKCIGSLISENLYNATSPTLNKIVGVNCTWAEYLWAMDFIYKYQRIIIRTSNIGLRAYGPDQNTIPFFDTDEFQLYGMNHYKEDCDFLEESQYKMPLRKYIFDNNKDEQYFKFKKKEFSMKKSYLLKNI